MMKKCFLLIVSLFTMFGLSAQNVGIDQIDPANKLDVNGGLSVGSNYSGTFAAPANGAIIEDSVGIGTNNPEAMLDVTGNARVSYLGIATLPDLFKGSRFTAVETTNTFSQGVVYGEFSGNPSSFSNLRGVVGLNIVDDNYGIGVEGQGGWRGTDGIVAANGGADYIGARGFVFNTQGQQTAENCGMFGSAQGDSSANYGVYGYAFGIGATNYAGYFAGNLGYTGTLSSPSDAKFKKEVNPLENSLDKILKLQPKSYLFKAEEFKEMNLSKSPQMGFIAQEAGVIFPNLIHENVFTRPRNDREDKRIRVEYIGFDYVSLIPVLTGAIQEQHTIIEDQKTEIIQQKQQIENLEDQLDKVISAMKKAGISLE